MTLSEEARPQDYEPLSIEFVGSSVSSPGPFEAFEAKVPNDDPHNVSQSSTRSDGDGAIVADAVLRGLHHRHARI